MRSSIRIIHVIWAIVVSSMLPTPVFSQSVNRHLQKVAELYSLHSTWKTFIDSKSLDAADKMALSIRLTYDNLSHEDREEIDQILIDDVSKYFEVDDKLFLFNAERLLLIIPETHPLRFDIICDMCETYYRQDDLDNLLKSIDRLKACDISSIDDAQDMIDSIVLKAKSIVPLEEKISGVWVSNIYSTSKLYHSYGQPWFVVKIGHTDNNFEAFIWGISGFEKGAFLEAPALRQSYRFDKSKNSFLFEFSASSEKRGNFQLATGLYETGQRLNATAFANSNKSNATFGQKLGAQTVGTTLALGFNILGDLASTSTARINQLYITGASMSNDLIKGQILWTDKSVDNYTNVLVDNSIPRRDITFWRWRKEDNVVFSYTDFSPCSPYVEVLTPDMDLYKLKKQNSYWPKYCLIAISLFAVSSVMTYFGMKGAVNAPEGSGKYYGNLALGILGMEGIIFSWVGTYLVNDSKKDKAIEKYNEEQMMKLARQHLYE